MAKLKGTPIGGLPKNLFQYPIPSNPARGGGGYVVYDDLASFPASGDTTLFYIADDTKLLYYWDGAVYIETSPGAGGGGDTLVSEGALINSAASKTTPVDADMLGLMDSAAANILKKLSWANIKATLKTYFDSLYPDDADVVHLAGAEIITGLKTIDATTGLALPATTGTTPSAGTNLRLESSDNTILDVGSASELNWLQSTDKTDLSVYYELLLNPRGGNVGIGILVIPTAKLQVFSDTPSAWAVEIMNDATGAGNGLYVNIGALSTGFPFRVDINGVEKFSVNNAGDTSVKGALGVTGDINLVENMGVMQDPALSADGKYSMTAGETGTLGEAIAFGEFTYFKTADSKYWKADASVVATSSGKIRVCVQAGIANDVVKLMKSGKIRADSLFPAGTIGLAAVLSETAGAIVNIASAPTATDTVTRIVGYWNTADELDVDISQNYITHV